MAPPVSRLQALLALNRRWPVLLLLAWLAVFGTRPFTLGFYHDDWWQYVEPVRTTTFSLERWSAFVGFDAVNAPRPINGIISFVLASISLDSAPVAQALAGLLALAAGWSLRRWLVELGTSLGDARYLAADFAAVFWLTAPWSTGSTIFLSAAIGILPSQFFFTEAARFSLTAPVTPRRSIVIALILLASYLTYEAFYFLVFPIMLGQWLIGRLRFPDRRAATCFWLALGTAQLAAIVLNRYVAVRNSGVSKSISAAWLTTWNHSLERLPRLLLETLGTFSAAWTCLAVVMVIASLAQAWRTRPALPSRRPLLQFPVLIATGLVCAIVIAGVYAVAGYGFGASGVMSRTLGGVTWALSVSLGGIAAFACLGGPTVWRRIALTAGVALLAVQFVALQHQQEKWAESWALQKKIIAGAPIADIARVPAGAAVLFIGPSYHAGVEIFAAPWDLSGSVLSLPPLIQNRGPFRAPIKLHPATDLYDWTFRSGQLVQELPGHFKQTFEARRLFVWDYDRGTFGEVADGYTRRPTASR